MPDEVENMAYYGATPWHKLGVPVQGAMTAKEAIVLAGLDWEVDVYPALIGNVPIKDGPSTSADFIKDKFVIARGTDGEVYNVVSSKYVPIQNWQCFEFFDAVVQSDAAKYHTAGSLKKGGVIWMLAKLNGIVEIANERVDKYLLLTNSHNGSFALQMFWTPIRVVCNNTLSTALQGKGGQTFYSRHTTNIQSRVDSAQEILGLATKFYDMWTEEAEKLAIERLLEKDIPAFLKASFGYEQDQDLQELRQPTIDAMERVKELVYVGAGMQNPAIQGTKWAGYNALAEYIDHEKIGKGGSDDSRLNSAWFGVGSEIKKRGWDHLLRN